MKRDFAKGSLSILRRKPQPHIRTAEFYGRWKYLIIRRPECIKTAGTGTCEGIAFFEILNCLRARRAADFAALGVLGVVDATKEKHIFAFLDTTRDIGRIGQRIGLVDIPNALRRELASASPGLAVDNRRLLGAAELCTRRRAIYGGDAGIGEQ